MGKLRPLLPSEVFSDILHKDTACLLIMEEASALSSTLHKFFIIGKQ